MNKPSFVPVRDQIAKALRASTKRELDKIAEAANASGGSLKLKKRPVKHEQPFHIAVVQALDLILPADFIYWHTPNGETGKGKFKGEIMKALGVVAGVHDLLILAPDGRLHGLELKIKPNTPTDAQIEFGEALVKRGCMWTCAYTMADVNAFVATLCRSYGVFPRGVAR